MKRQEHHVVTNPNGGWDVKRNGAEKASVHTDTKQEAMDKGRTISQNQNTEFITHGKNGKIQQSDSHGKASTSHKTKK
ncbi:DUF2188 domain-containing protein [uncultured Sphaerochaeta sp.]|uniref:DUF2188 domain-containing protein n=1 Tax=uncultured Sphaerochaeta sp. TaxID=886478 RepID=UPI002A0A6ED2|nr:DUF2188 domain-containing protein [uncultured Sphaerochaeta sp.]